MCQAFGRGVPSQHGVTYRANSESGEEVEVFAALGVPVVPKPLEVFVSRALDGAFDAAP